MTNQILILSLCLVVCFSGCGERQEQDSVPINRRLFEALKNNTPEVVYGLCPTAEEMYVNTKMCEGGLFSFHRYTWKEAQKNARRGAERLAKLVMQIRRLCEEKEFDWSRALLEKTTRRSFRPTDSDEEFNPDEPEGDFMVLNISDGKVSVVILASLFIYRSFKNKEEFDRVKARPMLNIETGFPLEDLIRTHRIVNLLLDPLTKEERKLLDRWRPGKDKNRDEKVKKILTNGHITRKFVAHWRSGLPTYKSGDENKWIYRYSGKVPELTILEIHFSEEGIVSNVLIKKEQNKDK